MLSSSAMTLGVFSAGGEVAGRAQGTPPHPKVLPVGWWDGTLGLLPERGFPGWARSCQTPGRNEAKEETAHSSMSPLCLLRIIVFPAKANRRGDATTNA